MSTAPTPQDAEEGLRTVSIIEVVGANSNGTTTAHHEALIGAQFRNPDNIIQQPTLATTWPKKPAELKYGLVADLFTNIANNNDDPPVHHRVVATEIVKDPVNQFSDAEPVLQNAIVLLDPKFPESTYLAQAGIKKGLMIMAVVPKPNDGAQGLNISANPTAAALLQEGFHQVYEPPHASKFDIVECAAHLKTIESQQHLRFLGVLPCREAAVDYSDILGALLGLTSVNDLGLASARRDKGLMKSVVANAGLRVAKFARLTDGTGSDVKSAIEELELEYPVVVKTPRGFSTMDVYICKDEAEAVLHSAEIVRSVGPDGRKTQYALLEEFLGGDEFAVNLIASPATARAVRVTDIWLYHKVNVAGTMVNTFQEMVDPTDKKFASIVKYAEGVCRAVGIKYGVGHCEIKATYDESKDKYVEPVMIEIAGRMAGGRKAAMAEATISGWLPFEAMIDAHCGFPIKMPPTFRPTMVAAQAYVPSDKAGIIKSVTGDNFDRLTSYHSHTIMRTVGDKVKRSTDLISFAAFVWLIGDGEDVRRDAMQAIHEFKVEVESA